MSMISTKRKPWYWHYGTFLLHSNCVLLKIITVVFVDLYRVKYLTCCTSSPGYRGKGSSVRRISRSAWRSLACPDWSKSTWLSSPQTTIAGGIGPGSNRPENPSRLGNAKDDERPIDNDFHLWFTYKTLFMGSLPLGTRRLKTLAWAYRFTTHIFVASWKG